MEAFITSSDAKARIQMVDEALQVHEANGTLDSLLAQRLRESRARYEQFADKTMGDKMMVRESDERPFTGRSSAASATRSGRSGQASEKAVGYAKSLMQQRQSEQLGSLLANAAERMLSTGKIDPRTCSGLIDALKMLPWRNERTDSSAYRSANAKVEQMLTQGEGTPAPLEAGYYRLGESFYRVKISKSSGRPYAELWDGGWDYEGGKGVARKLTADNLLTAEDAKAFGDLYHACIYCSTELTDQRSIDAGYGPKCAANNGLPWG